MVLTPSRRETPRLKFRSYWRAAKVSPLRATSTRLPASVTLPATLRIGPVTLLLSTGSVTVNPGAVASRVTVRLSVAV